MKKQQKTIDALLSLNEMLVGRLCSVSSKLEHTYRDCDRTIVEANLSTETTVDRLHHEVIWRPTVLKNKMAESCNKGSDIETIALINEAGMQPVESTIDTGSGNGGEWRNKLFKPNRDMENQKWKPRKKKTRDTAVIMNGVLKRTWKQCNDDRSVLVAPEEAVGLCKFPEVTLNRTVSPGSSPRIRDYWKFKKRKRRWKYKSYEDLDEVQICDVKFDTIPKGGNYEISSYKQEDSMDLVFFDNFRGDEVKDRKSVV